MPVHTQVVQGVVEIQAEEFVLVLTGEGDAVIASQGAFPQEAAAGAVEPSAADEEHAMQTAHRRREGDGSAYKGGIFAQLAHDPQGERHTAHRNEADQPEADGFLHEAEFPLSLAGLGGGEAAGDHEQQYTAGIPAHTPDIVDVPAFQGSGSGQTHEQHRHIEPPGIVGVIEEDKGAVESRHQCHEQAGEQELFQPAAPGRQQEGCCPRHAEQR